MSLNRFLKQRETLLALILVAIVAGVSWRAPTFIGLANLHEIATDSAILIVMALAQSLVIMTRGIDLSVAANVALSGMAAAQLSMHAPWLPIPLVLLFATLVGLALGLVNGVLVAWVRIPSIVATLGTMSLFRGLTFLAADGKWVAQHEMSAAFLAFPRLDVLGLSLLAWIGVLGIVVAVIFTRHAALGRELRALGGNPSAAKYVGIRETTLQLFVFAVAGAVAGLCGYLWVARYAIAYDGVALGFELQVIAACVIGGVSIAGGVGSVTGTVLGALFLVLIYNALPVVGISPFWQTAIVGAAILSAVILNARGDRTDGLRLILRSHPAH